MLTSITIAVENLYCRYIVMRVNLLNTERYSEMSYKNNGKINKNNDLVCSIN